MRVVVKAEKGRKTEGCGGICKEFYRSCGDGDGDVDT